MTKEQIIKKIKKQNMKYRYRDPGGSCVGSYTDKKSKETLFYHYDYEKDKVSFFETRDEAIKDMLREDWLTEHVFCYYYALVRKIDDIRYSIRKAIQRVKKGYDDSAIWEIDTWFREIFPKMIRELRNKASIPMIKNLVPDYDPTTKKNRFKRLPKRYIKAWYDVLTEMIDCFEGYVDIRGNNPYDYKNEKGKYQKWQKEQSEKNAKLQKRGLELFVKYFNYLSW